MSRMSIDLGQIPPFSMSSDILFRELGSEAILLHVPSGNYFTLNETAILYWQGISSGSPATGIEKVRAEFDVDDDQIQRDYLDFLNQLANCGIITWQGQDV